MRLLKIRYVFPLLVVLSILLHARIFSLDILGIHAWRQTETATVARNLARGDGDLLHPKVLDLAHRDRIYRMEVPLMQAAFAATCRAMPTVEDYRIIRALSSLLGLATVIGMYTLGRATSGREEVGTLAAWTFTWSPVFFYYTLNPMPDNAALCAAVWSTALLLQHLQRPQGWRLAAAAILLGVATAMKLPYVVFGAAALPPWWRAVRGRTVAHTDAWRIPLFYMVALMPAAAWYAAVVPGWKGNGVAAGILGTDKSAGEMLNYFSGHLISIGPELLVNYGSLPALVVALTVGIRKCWWRHWKIAPVIALTGAILLYYLYELPLIELVHDYYLMPFLPSIFLAVSAGAWWLLRQNNLALRTVGWAGLAVIPLTAFLRIDSRWDTREPGFNPDYVAQKAALQRAIPADARVITGPDNSRRIHLYHLDRVGWTFPEGGPSQDSLQQWKYEGARYLITDPQTAARLEDFLQNRPPIFATQKLAVYALP